MKSTSNRNQLRIIGGAWRGRRLAFPPVPGLRPTPDRVRETLFNWLAPTLVGARCLDLFAGSGALGLEAASRGAAQVVLVDSDRQVTAALREHAVRLQAGEAVEVVQADALTFLDGPARPFDVVFLDPPFSRGLLAPCIARLEAGGWLAHDGYLYLEAERHLAEPPLPTGWEIVRSKTAGQVGYHLARPRSSKSQG
ncbi:MAG TPA: 16S rRNA (guanine(966)-N(2))-methyltransferase RsmD [Gammaproteobacteria bacterium]|nr:16S rRNA (guanine(966)-N(2))-methyltransferase RsmD [Gammaproteobacteria bacterium]